MSPPAPRRLIYCMDGTWQSPDQRHPTNVFKTATLASHHDLQKVHYDSGVGTGWPRIAGGLFGTGLVQNILEGYDWIRQRYVPGDWIVLVGFSRGAHGVRQLADMLGAVGFDFPGQPARDIWRVYRNMHRTTKPIPVRAVAVWETVGARGVPVGTGRWAFAPQFSDCNLGNHVAYGFHAVAIDEARAAFTPCLWTNEAEHGSIQQVYFRGWHSDIGGGTPDPGLSDIPLEWMLRNLLAFAGVEFREGWREQVNPDPDGPMHLPGWITRLYGIKPRQIPINACIHHTALE